MKHRLPLHAILHFGLIAFLASIAAPHARADDFPTTQATSFDIRANYVDHEKAATKPDWPIHVEKRTTFKLTLSSKETTATILRIDRAPSHDHIYAYATESPDVHEWMFFPVLDPGDYDVEVWGGGPSKPGEPYELVAKELDAVLTDDDRKKAQLAIDRSTAFLLSKKPSAATDFPDKTIEALAMMALASAPNKQYADLIEKECVPTLAADFVETKDPVWNGHTVVGVAGDAHAGYEHSIATLAMAEVAQTFGDAKARDLAARGAEYLLATQNTSKKAKVWNGPFNPTNISYGGWRYRPESDSSDISVSGWCTIALGATAAANIDVPGMRDGIKVATAYVTGLHVEKNFGYDSRSEEDGDIRKAVGILITLLYGDPNSVNSAADDMDRHLPSFTQVDSGNNMPFYYGYYATRANYLRGGRAWETWRCAAIRRLVLLQSADGSWPQFADEHGLNSRYGVAMGIMILRMCLNDVPAYLKQEVRGF